MVGSHIFPQDISAMWNTNSLVLHYLNADSCFITEYHFHSIISDCFSVDHCNFLYSFYAVCAGFIWLYSMKSKFILHIFIYFCRKLWLLFPPILLPFFIGYFLFSKQIVLSFLIWRFNVFPAQPVYICSISILLKTCTEF